MYKSSEINRIQEVLRDVAQSEMRLCGDRISTDGGEKGRNAGQRGRQQEEKIGMAHTSDRHKAACCWQELDGRGTK